jgi:hypothetical protein
VGERVAHELAHRDAVGERLTEVSLEQARDPVPVLSQEGPVGAELSVEGLHRLLIRERSEDPAADISRQHLGAEEDDDAQEEERDECEAESLEEESSDRYPSALRAAEAWLRPP